MATKPGSPGREVSCFRSELQLAITPAPLARPHLGALLQIFHSRFITVNGVQNGVQDVAKASLACRLQCIFLFLCLFLHVLDRGRQMA